VSYLLGQAHHGGQLSDRVDATVDGHSTTIVTARTAQPLDGSLGCPETGTNAADCFGLQPDLILRIAVITTGDGPLLIWLRTKADVNPDMTTETQHFGEFLAGVRFSRRSPQTAAAPAASVIDGTYEWTITKDDALVHGTASDKSHEGLAIYPNTFTVVLEKGRWTMRETSTTDTQAGTFTVTGKRLDLRSGGNTAPFTFTTDADGTLHLTAVPPVTDPGGQFIMTTKPWTKK
jgi:hypothetical protein